MTADQIRQILELQPHPEGGFYREIHRGACTSIYFLITRDSFSSMHRVTKDEVFSFHLGDPVEQVRLHPEGRGERIVIGTDLAAGMRPQAIVPAGVWQGARLLPGGLRGWALLGCTVAPAFEFSDFELGDRASLLSAYPAFRDDILRLTRE